MHSLFPHQRPPPEIRVCYGQLAYVDTSYQREFTVYVTVHLGMALLPGLSHASWQTSTTVLSYNGLNILCALPVYPSTPQPSSTRDLFTVSVESTSVAAQLWNWLLSLSRVRLRCSVSFRGLTAHFFLALNHCLDGPQFVYPLTAEEHLTTAKFWPLWTNPVNVCVRVFMET